MTYHFITMISKLTLTLILILMLKVDCEESIGSKYIDHIGRD